MRKMMMALSLAAMGLALSGCWHDHARGWGDHSAGHGGGDHHHGDDGYGH